MRQKTLLVLAASLYQLEAIQTARQLGYRVVTTDNVPTNPGHALADRTYGVDITARDDVLQIAIDERVDGVIAIATDVGVPTRAYVTERLGLPGPPLCAATTVCDKGRLRDFLRARGLPCPEFRVVTAMSAVDPALFEGAWWILKPDRSSGAKGVRIIDSLDAFRTHLPEALAFSPSGTAVLERFIAGHQGTCEGIIESGEIVNAFFLDRQTVEPPFVTTTGHRMPTRLPARLRQALLHQLTEIWRELAVREGPFDCDFVAIDHEVFILDLSPRVGGNSIARLLRQAADFDIVAYAVRRACDDDVEASGARESRPAALVLFGVDREGALEYDETEAATLATEPWVVHLELDVPRGAPVRPFVNSRHRVGEALVVAADRDELDARVVELQRRLGLRAG